MRTSDDLRIGIIGGTGLGEALVEGLDPGDVEHRHPDTPFGQPSGPIVTGTFEDVPVALLQRHGPGHLLRPAAVPHRANVFALKALGCTHVVASGACGSLRESIRPGSLVVCDQLIDRTEGRPRTFYEHAAVHVEFADPMCPVTTQWLIDAAARMNEAADEPVRVHDIGCYVCMEGPSFSTRAESHWHRQMGADVVGMTALPEARLVREAEMAYALIALPTDDDCWRPRPADQDAGGLIETIIGNLRTASEAAIRLVRTALADVRPLRSTRSPAHDALALAIWSDESAIDPEEIERLRPLWGRHFAAARPATT